MSDFSKHKLVGEDKQHYHIQHPSGQTFKVAKHLLDMKMHVAISKMAKAPAQHFDDGGDVQSRNAYSGYGDTQPAPAADVITPPTSPDPVSASGPYAGIYQAEVAANPDMAAKGPQIDVTQPQPPATGTSLTPLDNGVPSAPTPDTGLATPDGQLPQQAATPQPTAPQQPAGPAIPDPSGLMIRGAQAGIDANNQAARAQTQLANDQAADYERQERARVQVEQDFKVNHDALSAERAQIADGIASTKIDPNRYFNNKSTGGKIVAIIASALGGGGAALAGQPNLAAQAIQNAIKADIEAQVEDLNTKKGLLRDNFERMHDLEQAKQLTYMQLAAAAQGQLHLSAARNGSALAAAQAAQLNAPIQAGLANNLANLAVERTKMQYMQNAQNQGIANSGGGATGYDQGRANGIVQINPKEETPIREETKAYQGVQKAVAHANHLFDVVPPLTSITSGLPGPTLRHDTRQMEAMTKPFLDSLTKDTSGRVTPETVELIGSLMPKYGDSPKDIAVKRAQVKELLTKDASFPTLEKYGIVKPTVSPSQTANQYKPVN